MMIKNNNKCRIHLSRSFYFFFLFFWNLIKNLFYLFFFLVYTVHLNIISGMCISTVFRCVKGNPKLHTIDPRIRCDRCPRTGSLGMSEVSAICIFFYFVPGYVRISTWITNLSNKPAIVYNK